MLVPSPPYNMRPAGAPTSTPPPSAPIKEDWLLILAPTEVYSLDMELLWMAQPGDRYRLLLVEDGYALAIWEPDANQWATWLEMDAEAVRRIVVVLG